MLNLLPIPKSVILSGELCIIMRHLSNFQVLPERSHSLMYVLYPLLSGEAVPLPRMSLQGTRPTQTQDANEVLDRLLPKASQHDPQRGAPDVVLIRCIQCQRVDKALDATYQNNDRRDASFCGHSKSIITSLQCHPLNRLAFLPTKTQTYKRALSD